MSMSPFISYMHELQIIHSLNKQKKKIKFLTKQWLIIDHFGVIIEMFRPSTPLKIEVFSRKYDKNGKCFLKKDPCSLGYL